MILNDPHVRYTASEYDRFTESFVRPYDDMLVDWVRREVGERQPNLTLVDVGAGTAQVLIRFAQMPELSECTLIGTDVFEDMIEQARHAVSTASLTTRIQLLQDDIHSSRLASQYADLLLSRSTLHHWRNPAMGLREIFRILRPGGRAMIIDVRRDAPVEAVAYFNDLRAQAGLEPSVLEEKFTISEVQEFVEAAGIGSYTRVKAEREGRFALGLAVIIDRPIE